MTYFTHGMRIFQRRLSHSASPLAIVALLYTSLIVPPSSLRLAIRGKLPIVQNVQVHALEVDTHNSLL